MPSGSSLKFMMEKIPKRAFDVAIAEQHAVTFSAGLSTEGIIPFCNIYSTFLQRAYDQVIHDVAIQNLHVIFCIDREEGNLMFGWSFLARGRRNSSFGDVLNIAEKLKKKKIF